MSARPSSQPLRTRPRALSSFAEQYGLELRGPDLLIRSLGFLASNPTADDHLAYAGSAAFVEEFTRRPGACIVPRALAGAVPDGRSILVAEGSPVDVLYAIFVDLVNDGAWESIESHRGQRVTIAPTAVVHEPVWIGDDCVIMDHVVIFPNTVLGDHVVIKPNATVGGDGFEVRQVHGRKQVIPHAGGVYLDDYVQIGSSTCVDRGLFGEFTFLGAETKVDNLIHVAHRVTVGRRCALTACSEYSGGVVLGDDVWVGPNSMIGNDVNVGDGCFIGIGALVLRSLPPHALAYGSPAKALGSVCLCRAKLSFEGEGATCGRCGREYRMAGGGVTPVTPGPDPRA